VQLPEGSRIGRDPVRSPDQRAHQTRHDQRESAPLQYQVHLKTSSMTECRKRTHPCHFPPISIPGSVSRSKLGLARSRVGSRRGGREEAYFFASSAEFVGQLRLG
jgi:hypothetical protein